MARSVDANQFGAFSVALVLYVLVIGLSQSAVGEPSLLTFHLLSAREQRQTGLACMIAGAALGVVAGLVLLAATPFVPDSLADCLRVLALALPLLVAHDCGRFVFIAAGRAAQALIADAVWTALWGVGVVVLGTRSAAHGLALWGFASAAGALCCLLLLRPRLPTRDELVGGLTANRPLRLRLIGEYVSVSAGAQLTVLGFAAVGGLIVGGGVRAAQSLLGPLNTVFNATRVVTTPDSAKRFRRDGAASLGMPLAVSGGVVGVAVVVGVVALVLPDSIGRELLGDSWTVADQVMPLIVLHRILGASVIGPLGMLRAAGMAGPLMVRRGLAECTGGVVCILVTVLVDPWWGVAAMLLSPLLDTVLTWLLLVSTWRRQRQDAPAAEPA